MNVNLLLSPGPLSLCQRSCCSAAELLLLLGVCVAALSSAVKLQSFSC